MADKGIRNRHPRHRHGNFNIVPTTDHFTPGTCSVQLRENDAWKGWNDLGSRRDDLFSFEQLTIKDRTGRVIGHDGFSSGGDGAAIVAGDNDPYPFLSALHDVLMITPESRNDYVQFALGSQMWKSSDAAGSAWCDTGKWVQGLEIGDRSTRVRLVSKISIRI